MNLGSLIGLLKLAQDTGLTSPSLDRPDIGLGPKGIRDPSFVSVVVRPTYGKETALTRAKEGLGL